MLFERPVPVVHNRAAVRFQSADIADPKRRVSNELNRNQEDSEDSYAVAICPSPIHALALQFGPRVANTFHSRNSNVFFSNGHVFVPFAHCLSWCYPIGGADILGSHGREVTFAMLANILVNHTSANIDTTDIAGKWSVNHVGIIDGSLPVFLAPPDAPLRHKFASIFALIYTTIQVADSFMAHKFVGESTVARALGQGAKYKNVEPFDFSPVPTPTSVVPFSWDRHNAVPLFAQPLAIHSCLRSGRFNGHALETISQWSVGNDDSGIFGHRVATHLIATYKTEDKIGGARPSLGGEKNFFAIFRAFAFLFHCLYLKIEFFSKLEADAGSPL